MRQLVLSVPPDREGCAILSGSEYRYLVQVLRKVSGDVIEVRLPDGTLTLMKISAIERKDKRVLLSPERRTPAEKRAEPGNGDYPKIILFQWLLKGPKMDQVIRQATETGVACIVPVAGERCLSRDADSVGEGKTGRWERIVREARQQSGSPVATDILPPVSVPDIPALWKSLTGEISGIALVLTEAPLARKSLHGYLGNGAGLTALAIGPEGGMTSGEMALLDEAGFLCVHFRTNILRAETAALYGIAAVQSALTELEKWQLKE